MKISTILKNILFIGFLVMSVSLVQAVDYSANITVLSKNPIEKASPEFQKGFTTLVQAKVYGLPKEFEEGDTITTNAVFLSQNELLSLEINVPHSYRVGDYFNQHDIGFSIGKEPAYNTSILKFDVLKEHRYWSFLSLKPTSIKYQYQRIDSDETEWRPGYKAPMTTATLCVSIIPFRSNEASRP